MSLCCTLILAGPSLLWEACLGIRTVSADCIHAVLRFGKSLGWQQLPPLLHPCCRLMLQPGGDAYVAVPDYQFR